MTHYLDNYDGWLEKIAKERTLTLTDDDALAETFMLIRKSDNKLLGMISMRFGLNKKMLAFAKIGISLNKIKTILIPPINSIILSPFSFPFLLSLSKLFLLFLLLISYIKEVIKLIIIHQ